MRLVHVNSGGGRGIRSIATYLESITCLDSAPPSAIFTAQLPFHRHPTSNPTSKRSGTSVIHGVNACRQTRWRFAPHHTARSALMIVPLYAATESRHERTAPLKITPRQPGRPTASPPPAPKPTPPVSPFRRLLALNLNQVSDLRHERRSPRCRPSQFSLQTIPAFGATDDMLFDSAHLVMGHDIPERQITLEAVSRSRCFPF